MGDSTPSRNLTALRLVRDRLLSDLLNEWQVRWDAIDALGRAIALLEKELSHGPASP